MATQAQQDGFVECSECGHPVEQHDENGCGAIEACSCPVTWSLGEIALLRASEGLPAVWDPYAVQQ